MSAQGEIRYNNVDELLVRMKKETFEENVKLRAMKDTIIQHINDLMPRLDIRYHKILDELQTKNSPDKRKIMIMTVKMNNIYHMYETLKEHMEKRIAEGEHIVSSVASLQSDSSLHLKEKEKLHLNRKEMLQQVQQRMVLILHPTFLLKFQQHHRLHHHHHHLLLLLQRIEKLKS
jgi:hypothetical protein